LNADWFYKCTIGKRFPKKEALRLYLVDLGVLRDGHKGGKRFADVRSCERTVMYLTRRVKT